MNAWCGSFHLHAEHDICLGWGPERRCEHTFAYDAAGRMRCECGTYLFQHAPDHPYGSQAGPGGQYARWCLLEDCDWRQTGGAA